MRHLKMGSTANTLLTIIPRLLDMMWTRLVLTMRQMLRQMLCYGCHG